MTKHNFNFSDVTAVNSIPTGTEVVVSTYQSSEDGPIVHEAIPLSFTVCLMTKLSVLIMALFAMCSSM